MSIVVFFQPFWREKLTKMDVALKSKMKMTAGPNSTMYMNIRTPITLLLVACSKEIQIKLADWARRQIVHTEEIIINCS